jgi:hypothetical protein
MTFLFEMVPVAPISKSRRKGKTAERRKGGRVESDLGYQLNFNFRREFEKNIANPFLLGFPPFCLSSVPPYLSLNLIFHSSLFIFHLKTYLCRPLKLEKL